MSFEEEPGHEREDGMAEVSGDSVEHAPSLGEELHQLSDAMWDSNNISQVADVIERGIKSPVLNHQILARQTLEFILMMSTNAVDLAKSIEANQGQQDFI